MIEVILIMLYLIVLNIHVFIFIYIILDGFTNYIKDDDVEIMIKSTKSEYMEEVEYSFRLLRKLLPVKRLMLYTRMKINDLVILSDSLNRHAKYECDLLLDAIGYEYIDE